MPPQRALNAAVPPTLPQYVLLPALAGVALNTAFSKQVPCLLLAANVEPCQISPLTPHACNLGCPAMWGASLSPWAPLVPQVAALRPALLSAASTALICGALLAQHSAAVLEAAPRLVAAAVGLHTGAACMALSWLGPCL